jgi:glutathione peroxidase
MTERPLTDIALTTLDGRTTTLAELADGAALVVNVASKCGLISAVHGAGAAGEGLR